MVGCVFFLLEYVSINEERSSDLLKASQMISLCYEVSFHTISAVFFARREKEI